MLASFKSLHDLGHRVLAEMELMELRLTYGLEHDVIPAEEYEILFAMAVATEKYTAESVLLYAISYETGYEVLWFPGGIPLRDQSW